MCMASSTTYQAIHVFIDENDLHESSRGTGMGWGSAAWMMKFDSECAFCTVYVWLPLVVRRQRCEVKCELQINWWCTRANVTCVSVVRRCSRSRALLLSCVLLLLLLI